MSTSLTIGFVVIICFGILVAVLQHNAGKAEREKEKRRRGEETNEKKNEIAKIQNARTAVGVDLIRRMLQRRRQ